MAPKKPLISKVHNPSLKGCETRPISMEYNFFTTSDLIIIAVSFTWLLSCAGSRARLFWFCRLGPWQGIQSFSFIQKYNIKGMHLWLGKFLKPFAWWCFASASCKQQRRRGCYRILEAKVKGEFHLYVVLHCIVMKASELNWMDLRAEDAPSAASPSQADLRDQLNLDP